MLPIPGFRQQQRILPTSEPTYNLHHLAGDESTPHTAYRTPHPVRPELVDASDRSRNVFLFS
ncbi:hypothetical protein BO70DRAFT_366074 [Aspergillus heteromorphus CBS 117.55]|uniref:Uncharacterized protein n=1 Tax=Aspergillus heteromorphus CBS 117.55 TaxID=1448321 RepID=A0A317V650_9EURO|nr:uncharacterized protein BO70DRAFT_366074 [Aspergillus heteromorphus CBS 117.55]PWY68407.1 hypothetical protein BO70DRAFT_366074 [Aspergillus heteromorphus CBS 117.55]